MAARIGVVGEDDARDARGVRGARPPELLHGEPYHAQHQAFASSSRWVVRRDRFAQGHDDDRGAGSAQRGSELHQAGLQVPPTDRRVLRRVAQAAPRGDRVGGLLPLAVGDARELVSVNGRRRSRMRYHGPEASSPELE